MSDQQKNWEKNIEKHLVGRKIVKIEYLSQSECEDCMWNSRPIVLILDDDNYLIPMRDDEGNDGGSLSTSFTDLPIIPVMN
jgi:hypothetical protein